MVLKKCRAVGSVTARLVMILGTDHVLPTVDWRFHFRPVGLQTCCSHLLCTHGRNVCGTETGWTHPLHQSFGFVPFGDLWASAVVVANQEPENNRWIRWTCWKICDLQKICDLFVPFPGCPGLYSLLPGLPLPNATYVKASKQAWFLWRIPGLRAQWRCGHASSVLEPLEPSGSYRFNLMRRNLKSPSIFATQISKKARVFHKWI